MLYSILLNRALGAFLTSATLVLLSGGVFIKFARRYLVAGVRAYVPASHQAKKHNPSMGGLLILASAGLTTLCFANYHDLKISLTLLALGLFGAIGLLDDWLKLKYRTGLKSGQKFVLQIIASTIIILVWSGVAGLDTKVIFFSPNWQLDLGFLWPLWAIFVIIATSNAVNLTDGLDGLASNCLIASLLFFMSTNLFLGSELAILNGSLIGSLVGFLWFNAFPAQIFMGDVGAIALGAGLGLVALLEKQELWLSLVGAVFVAETLSVILQVLWVKFKQARLFKMTPLHHHFELLNWPETKIVARFTIVAVLMLVLSLLLWLVIH